MTEREGKKEGWEGKVQKGGQKEGMGGPPPQKKAVRQLCDPQQT